MEQVQPNEVATLVFGLAGALILIRLAKESPLPGFRLFYLAYGSVVAAYWFTVLEGFLWARFLNFLEHLSLAAAGILFLAAILRHGRGRSGGEG